MAAFRKGFVVFRYNFVISAPLSLAGRITLLYEATTVCRSLSL